MTTHINYQWKIEDTGSINVKTDITDLINNEIKKLESVYGTLKIMLLDEQLDNETMIFKFPGITYRTLQKSELI